VPASVRSRSQPSLLTVPFAVPMSVSARILYTLFTIIALVRLGLEVPGDNSIITFAGAFGPYQLRSHVMILRQKMNVYCIDHFRVAGWMTLPVAIGFPVRGTIAEIVNIGPKVKVQSDVRPTHAALSQIHHHCRIDARSLCHEKRYRNLIWRECAVAN